MTAPAIKNSILPPANPVASAEFFVPAIRIPQGDGSLLVKAGQPQMVSGEVGTSQFAKETGMSQRWCEHLCGLRLIKHRRMSPAKGSKILIPRSEVRRFLSLSDDAGMPSKMTADDLARVQPPKNASSASYPIARRGSSASGGRSNPKKSTAK